MSPRKLPIRQPQGCLTEPSIDWDDEDEYEEFDYECGVWSGGS